MVQDELHVQKQPREVEGDQRHAPPVQQEVGELEPRDHRDERENEQKNPLRVGLDRDDVVVVEDVQEVRLERDRDDGGRVEAYEVVPQRPMQGRRKCPSQQRHKNGPSRVRAFNLKKAGRPDLDRPARCAPSIT